MVFWAALEDDDPVGREIGRARTEINRAALAALDGEQGPEADGLRAEYVEILRLAEDDPDGFAPPRTSQDELRLRSIEAARGRLHALRASGDIGNDAFRPGRVRAGPGRGARQRDLTNSAAPRPLAVPCCASASPDPSSAQATPWGDTPR